MTYKSSYSESPTREYDMVSVYMCVCVCVWAGGGDTGGGVRYLSTTLQKADSGGRSCASKKIGDNNFIARVFHSYFCFASSWPSSTYHGCCSRCSCPMGSTRYSITSTKDGIPLYCQCAMASC